jgi:hypothetical protein
MKSSANKIWIIAGLVLLITISIAPANAAAFTFSGEDACVPVGSTADISITLSDVPGGLSGLNITFAISDPETATVTNISYPNWAAMHTNSSLPADQFWLKMVDLQQVVNPGDLNVAVCRVTILARKSGSSVITVTPVKVEDDTGGRYTLTPGKKTLCTGDSTAGSQPLVYQISGTPNPTETPIGLMTPTITTPLPVSTISTQLPGTQPSSLVLQMQATNSSLTPTPSDTLSRPNVTTGDITLPVTTTRVALPIILPLISCIVSVVVFSLIKRDQKE